MAKTIWGLDFGDWSLKVVRGSYDKKSGSITVDLFDEFVYGELPCGYEASPLEKQREGIIAFRNKHEIAPGSDLCVSVPGNEVFSRFINLPPVPGSVDEIMRYEAGQQIPFDMEDVVWDYQQVKEDQEMEEGEEIETGLFALKKDRVDELMDLLEPWRRNLRVVQNAPLAVYNLLEYEGLVTEPFVVLDIGSATTDVLVLNPPRYWIRTLLVAGNDLTNALMEQFGVSVEEAETIKRRAARSVHRDQIMSILQPVFDDLTNEVQRSLGYYKSLVRDVKFEKVLVLGATLKMTDLDQMLAKGLQYEVETIRELRRIQLAGTVDRARFQSALPGTCAALGLLVQGAGQGRVRINMVPEEVATAAAVAAKKPWVLAAAIGALVVAGVFVLGERLYAQDLEEVVERFPHSTLERVETLGRQYTAQLRQATELEGKLRELEEPSVDPAVFAQLLSVVSRTLPKDVYITSLSFMWLEPEQIVEGSALGGGRRPGGMGPMRRVMPGMGPGGMVEDIDSLMFEGTGPDMGALGGPPGIAPTELGPLSSANSKLVMRFEGESRRIKDGKLYIEEQVFGALEKAVFRGKTELVFSEVKMVGDVHDVYRQTSDGAAASESMRTREEVEQFVAFEGYAVVSTGDGAEPR